MNMTLKDILHPLQPDEFFATTFERRPVLLTGPQIKRWSGAHLWSLVASAALIAPGLIRVVSRGELRSPSRGLPREDLFQWIRDHYSDGCTVVLNKMEQLDPESLAITRCLSLEIGARASCTCFLTPADSQGFAPHFDTDDVLVVQTEGEKRWQLCGFEIPLPTTRQGYLVTSAVRDQTAESLLLTSGRTLYVPRGLIHWAEAQSMPSAHVSIDINVVLASQAIRAEIQRLKFPGLDEPLARNRMRPEDIDEALASLRLDPACVAAMTGSHFLDRPDRNGAPYESTFQA